MSELSTNHDAGIDCGDVAAEQLVRIWRDEARRGEEAVERFSRRMLVGELHRDIPDGWRPDWTSDEAKAGDVQDDQRHDHFDMQHSDEYRPATDRVFHTLLAEGCAGKIPSSWQPANADDPLLVEIFRWHWPEPALVAAARQEGTLASWRRPIQPQCLRPAGELGLLGACVRRSRSSTCRRAEGRRSKMLHAAWPREAPAHGRRLR